MQNQILLKKYRIEDLEIKLNLENEDISYINWLENEIQKLQVKDEVMKNLIDEQKKQLDIYVVKLDNAFIEASSPESTIMRRCPSTGWPVVCASACA